MGVTVTVLKTAVQQVQAQKGQECDTQKQEGDSSQVALTHTPRHATRLTHRTRRTFLCP